MMRYLVGDFNEVIGTSGIIIPKRQKLDGSGLGDVTTEDYSMPWLLWKMISVLPCALPNLHGEEKIHSVWKSTEAVVV